MQNILTILLNIYSPAKQIWAEWKFCWINNSRWGDENEWKASNTAFIVIIVFAIVLGTAAF